MKITKTVVNAKSRQLKATWSAGLAKPPVLSPQAREYAVTAALKRSLLQSHGTRVEVYTNDWDATMEWCQKNCLKHWDNSRDEVLSSPSILQRETALACGTADSNTMEVLYVNALARQVNLDAAEAEGRKTPYIYFWFEDANEAMRFKLAWGGL